VQPDQQTLAEAVEALEYGARLRWLHACYGEYAMSKVHRLRPRLTVNGQFMRDFLSAEIPCFALGMVEERQRPCGFLALRPPKVIPPTITNAGFRFGHALLGNADVAVVQFVFAFYGFETYNVLVNPTKAWRQNNFPIH
jgi:hypothetical protein